MSSRLPLISVVIPSRSAPASLLTTLQALAVQTLAPAAYEVLVAAGVTEDVVRERVPPGLPYALQILFCPGPGAARRRNAGARAARGEILVFLDDDMEPQPQLLAAHAEAHNGGNDSRAVIGYLPPAETVTRADGSVDFLAAALRDWWEAEFEAMAQPGHRFAYTNVLSGNLSLSAALFDRTGGFAERYTCREDYELGVRLLLAGAELCLAPAARSYHRDTTHIPRLLQRKTDEGRADVRLARQYPHVRPALALAVQFEKLDISSRVLRYVARRWPPIAALAVRLLLPLLAVCELLRLRYVWRRLIGGLLVYAYWRGVFQETRDWEEVRGLTAGPAPSLGTVDLARGSGHMEQVLRQCPLHGVRFTWRGLPLGRIEPQAYAEPVRRAHVAAWLLGEGAVAVASAEALDSVLGLGEGGAGEACVSLACAALAAAPDLARVQACARSPGGTRAAEADPAWILEVNLAEGRRALQPLLTTYGQQVLVRQGELPIGALYLPPCEEPRSLGEVVYALLAQLQPSTWLA